MSIYITLRKILSLVIHGNISYFRMIGIRVTLQLMIYEYTHINIHIIYRCIY
jgi:hypothetical protein